MTQRVNIDVDLTMTKEAQYIEGGAIMDRRFVLRILPFV